MATVGENVFVFGGIYHGRVVDDLHMFNTGIVPYIHVCLCSASLVLCRLSEINMFPCLQCITAF